ncbi:peptide chain release factor N(5)-glutamine methyltransferase [Nocardioides bizhenqiangii]|uniref:Release factor glutamine methyltransferase n=1 Tax=Nocardioides bizhenqiangii TaxID=3095076 RepID=A0ABZ0ZLK2_9ACTN|nr:MULTISPECIES: peptide chain release factor N(5)-glutamine methyltransferase [unclassified Nocardioides]MDZ5620833.1 peptide chain release factor N(5)-glutamine methyltransferase [Nocardioides sp. HM23]WQQ25197.1 peptide chain release factor N(5)-glutamine methyltransferase [Nocardioides sp. HM61]
MTPRDAVRGAAERLRAAGVASPEHDAAELLAHVLGTTRAQLPALGGVLPEAAAELERLVERRAARVPLQHLTGLAHFRHVTLAVGPGVFVPRPETELLAGWAIESALALEAPVVVDLCTGSGAIARAIKDEAPHAEVHAVELDEPAHAWAERNLAGTDVDLRQGDFRTAFDDLLGTVDVVVSNPPYVPLEAWESVALEARDHDPHLALFSGADGLDAIRAIAVRAADLLRPGGVVGVEHADVQGESAPAVLAAEGRWEEVRDHRDLADRPRFVTARRAVRRPGPGE